MPAKKSTRVKTSVRTKKPVRVTGAFGPKATLVVAGCVILGGILVGARQQSPLALRTTPRGEMVPMPEAPPKSLGDSSAAAMASTAVTAAAPKTPAVTLTGCLVQSDGSFRLKDTGGAGAPKSRSWKSGFLKKGSATIDVVDTAHALKLASHVGQRIRMTGTLVDREMQARSLHRVAASCGQ